MLPHRVKIVSFLGSAISALGRMPPPAEPSEKGPLCGLPSPDRRTSQSAKRLTGLGGREAVTAHSETSYRGAPPVATLVTIEEPVGGKSDGTAGINPCKSPRMLFHGFQNIACVGELEEAEDQVLLLLE